MDCMPTSLLDALRDEGCARIKFCTLSADRQLETALIADGNDHSGNRADSIDADAITQCYAGDFFSPLLIAARPHTLSGS